MSTGMDGELEFVEEHKELDLRQRWQTKEVGTEDRGRGSGWRKA